MIDSGPGKTRNRRGSEKPTRQLLAEGLPPQNLEAERGVLGAILRDNACMSDVCRQLHVENFYSANHQKIYQAMVSMFDEGKPIDVVTLANDLASKGWLLEIGGATTLADVYE